MGKIWGEMKNNLAEFRIWIPILYPSLNRDRKGGVTILYLGTSVMFFPKGVLLYTLLYLRVFMM